MVDNGAEKPKVRSQIAFIGREVTVLETDYSHLAEAHEKLKGEKADVDAELAKLKSKKKLPSFRVIDHTKPATFEAES